jgi:TnpA family transposase
MLAWHVPFLGWQRLPADLSEFEIAHFFTLKPADIWAVRSRYKKNLRLGAALQLGFLSMCGRPLSALQRAPADLLQHLGKQLAIRAPDIATLRAIYRRRRSTLFEHQAWATSHLGMRRLQESDTATLTGPLSDVVRAGIFGDHLLAATRRILYEQQIVIPGHRRLGDLARDAMNVVEREAMALIERDIPATRRAGWAEALAEPWRDGEPTLFEYLQEPPGKFSPGTIDKQFHKVQRLRDLEVSSYLVAAFTPAQLQAYSQGMRRRRPSRSAQLKEPRRTIELVSFLQHALLEHTDLLIRLIDRRVSQLWRRALEQARGRRGESSASEAFVVEVRRALADTETPVAERLSAIESLLGQLDAGTLRAPCLAARQREVLVEQCSQIRPLIKMLLELDLESDEGGRWRVLLDAWRWAYRQDLDYVTKEMCPPESRAWAALRGDPASLTAYHAAEAQLLWELRQGLRRGSLYIPHSLSYRSPAALFDSSGTTVRAPGSQRDPVEFLDQLCAQLEVALEDVAEAVWFEHLEIDGTKIHQHRLGPHDTPYDLPEVRDAMYASHPMIHLPEIVVDVDAKVRFSWILLGREPTSEEELLYIYVALLGHAMDIGAKRLSLMAPGLTVSGLTDALQLLEEPGPLRRANAAAVEFLQAHPLAAYWGNTGDCAADAMSLDGTRHIWLARTDPKRRLLSTATYVHTLARRGIAYDQPIPITRRQDGAAIEGALRQTIMPIRRVMTDTHGYSAFGMGLAKMEGLDLCPRLKSFRDRRLHIPRGGRLKVPDELKPVCLADVSLQAIIDGWPDLSTIADAVAGGRLSAVLACERNGTAARGQKGYRAAHELGLLLRTQHQCDTLTIPDFRRTTLRLLNDNERTHMLQRQIRRAGSRSRRGRRAEELSAQSGALALVTNVVMAWNAHQMQGTVDRWHATGERQVGASTAGHLTPMGFEHINFDGVLAFPLTRHRARLLPSSSPPATPDRAVG